MADNVEADPGTGGAVFAADDIAGVHHQRVKVQYGVDGAATDVSDTNPMPVDDAGGSLTVDAAELTAIQAAVEAIQTAVEILDNTVSGTEMQVDVLTIAAGDNNIGNVDVASSALPTGAATSANQSTANTALAAIETAVELIDDAISGTEMQVDVVAALPTGDNNIGNVDLASAIPAGTNLIGAVNVKPATSGGLTTFRSIDLDETEEEVKATAGQVYGWYFYNDGAAEVYIHLYNATTANVTVGSTAPLVTIPVPAGSASNVEFTNGIAFGTAITAAAATTVGGADAPAPNQVIANIFYA